MRSIYALAVLAVLFLVGSAFGQSCGTYGGFRANQTAGYGYGAQFVAPVYAAPVAFFAVPSAPTVKIQVGAGYGYAAPAAFVAPAASRQRIVIRRR